MRIKLKNFKCHLDQEFEINDNKLTLISGPSGIGKTSIIQAIWWCYYGGLRGVYNNTNNDTCSVTIIHDNIYQTNSNIYLRTIYRQSRSNLFKIEYSNGVVYEDIVAQNIINSYYGTKDVWTACSIISQDSKSSLILGSNKDRMEILNKLSFISDDPEECINRIDIEIKTQNKVFTNIQSVYTAELNSFNNDSNLNINIFSYALTPDQRKLKTTELDTANFNYTTLYNEKNNQQLILGKISILSSNISIVNDKITNTKNQINSIKLPIYPDIGIDDIINIINTCNNDYEIINKTLMSEYDIIKTNYDILNNKFILYTKLKNDISTYNTTINGLSNKSNILIKYETQYNYIKNTINTINNNSLKLIDKINLYKDIDISNIDNNLNILQNKKNNNALLVSQYISDINELQSNIKLNTNNIKYKEKFILDNNNKLYIINNDIILITDSIKNLSNDISNKLSDIIFTNNDIWNTEQIEKQLNNMKNISISLDILYSKENIMNEKNRINDQLQLLSKLEHENNIRIKIDTLNNEYNQYSNYKYISDDDIQTSISTYEKILQCVDIMTCPHCNKSVRLNGKDLISSEFISVTEDQIKKSKQLIDTMKKQKLLYETGLNIKYKIDSLSKLISTTNSFHLDQIHNEKTKLLERKDKILQLQYIETPKYTSSYMKEILNNFNIKNKINDLTLKLNTLQINNDTIVHELENNNKNIQELNNKILVDTDKYNTINNKYNLILDIINNDTIEIQKLKDTLNKITTSHLEYKSNKLQYEKYITDIKDYETQLINIQINIDNENKNIEQSKYDIQSKLDICINKLKEYDTIEDDILKYKNNLNNINNKINNNTNDYNIKKTELEIKEKNIRNSIHEYDNIITKQNNIKLQLKEYSDNLSQLYKDKDELDKKIILDIDKQILDMNNMIIFLKEYLNNATICDNFYSRRKILEGKCEYIKNVYNSLMSLNEFRQIAIDLECIQLQSTVDSINLIMNYILEDIFDHPISVRLKLYKKIKSNKRMKPSVNLSITYKGVDYDGINGLSGGEGDRISLALAIAMSKNSLSPFLLLDESMKSIDDNLRTLSIEVIRKVLGDSKTIICINHEDTEGNYDHVIKLS